MTKADSIEPHTTVAHGFEDCGAEDSMPNLTPALSQGRLFGELIGGITSKPCTSRCHAPLTQRLNQLSEGEER
jgi:hypothetical protein